MMNAIKVGHHILNSERIVQVREGNEQVRVFLTTTDLAESELHFYHTEAAALLWWFTQADRSFLHIYGNTVDIVERHREHLEALAAADQATLRLAVVPRPVVVCLCGSSRFRAAFEEANRNETLAGRIVLSIGMFGHHEGLDMDGPVKAAIDDLHFRKIDLADSVLVLNVGGYIGYSTGREVAYARSLGKPIRFLEDPTVEMVETWENEGGAA